MGGVHKMAVLGSEQTSETPTRDKCGGWSKALLALFACHPKFLASAKLFAVPKVPKVPNF